MKRIYMTPAICLQSIDAEDFMDGEVVSLPIHEEASDELIQSSEEVLGNGASVWDE
ncbi:MAG: hypothetical protein J5637_07025 [Prevotella sp.]|nr:hypothetical protein [Prevotella sp.]